MRSVFSCFLFLVSVSCYAQRDMDSIRDRLDFHSDVMVSALEAENRQYAAEHFYRDFKILLDSVNVFNLDMNRWRTLSVIDEQNDRFRLVSWQLEKASFEFEYFAFLVWPDGDYIEFSDVQNPENAIQYMSLSPDDWYGALYYNLVPMNEESYLLFGYNAYGQYDHVKIADVLHIVGKEVKLGQEVFEDKQDKGRYNYRVLLKYSSDASVNLNYNPGLKMIVFDHLMPRMGKQEGQGPTMIPDGTYEAFERSADKWKYISKLYNHSYGENNAPRPKPVLDDNGKDIFGKNK